MKTIGILGGMGPVATGEFFNRIMSLCQKWHGAVQDGDYPPISVYSMSLQGSNESGIKNEKVLEREFLEGIEELGMTKCDFVTIPCNTAHHFIAQMKKKTRVPIISITDETVARVEKEKMKRIGLLASESTYIHKVYGKPFASHHIEVVEPTDEEKRILTRMVLHVMGGKLSSRDKADMKTIVSRMKREDKIQAVVVGCTELSLVLKTDEYPTRAFDALDVLAEAAVTEAYK
jgi:aspartate racemase